MRVEDWKDLAEGSRFFNEHSFWHAHEAWEGVWRRHPEESRIFFQGIIQLAAAYDLLLVRKRYGGAMRNFEKATERLKLFPDCFLGFDVATLLRAIDTVQTEAAGNMEGALDRFTPSFVPRIVLSRR